MKTLLKMDSSAAGDNSKSRQLADEFISRWLAKNPEGKVITRDVDASPLPHFNRETFTAGGQAMGEVGEVAYQEAKAAIAAL